jgi:hypothetical protein
MSVECRAQESSEPKAKLVHGFETNHARMVEDGDLDQSRGRIAWKKIPTSLKHIKMLFEVKRGALDSGGNVPTRNQ